MGKKESDYSGYRIHLIATVFLWGTSTTFIAAVPSSIRGFPIIVHQFVLPTALGGIALGILTVADIRFLQKRGIKWSYPKWVFATPVTLAPLTTFLYLYYRGRKLNSE